MSPSQDQPPRLHQKINGAHHTWPREPSSEHWDARKCNQTRDKTIPSTVANRSVGGTRTKENAVLGYLVLSKHCIQNRFHFARITVLQNWKSWLCASTKFASRFCASTKFESRFCASTKWSYWRKVIFVLAHFCNQDFVLAQNFDSRFCASTKSKNHDFLYNF